MRAIIQRWGNSNAVRIPKSVMLLMELSENDTVDMLIEDKVLTIRKRSPRETLVQIIEKFYGKDFESIMNDRNEIQPKEFSWGDDAGKEVVK